jgi:hypothetical protein
MWAGGMVVDSCVVVVVIWEVLPPDETLPLSVVVGVAISEVLPLDGVLLDAGLIVVVVMAEVEPQTPTGGQLLVVLLGPDSKELTVTPTTRRIFRTTERI